MKFWEGVWLLKEALLVRAKNLQPRVRLPNSSHHACLCFRRSASLSWLPRNQPLKWHLSGSAYLLEQGVVYKTAEMPFQWLLLAEKCKLRKGPGPNLTNPQNHQQPYLDCAEPILVSQVWKAAGSGLLRGILGNPRDHLT